MQAVYKDLMDAARKAAANFYAPYSNFAVGSAVLSSSGKVYIGTNVENASYGLTNCAERSALFNAFSHGERKIEAVAIWSKNPEIFPCGACRQVILELAPDADIIINGREDKLIVLNVSDLMPFAFDKTNLK